MRELARDLGVSYPTARQRFADLLVRLGLEAGGADVGAPPFSREDVLRRLAAGELDLDEAAALLDLPGPGMSVPAGMLAEGGQELSREDIG
jgi:hypothetical protein